MYAIRSYYVRVLQQNTTQGHPAFLAAGEHAALHIRRWAAQRVHGHLQAGVQVPGINGIKLVLDNGLSVDQGLHGIVIHRLGKLLVDGIELIQQINRGLGPFLNHLAHGLFRIQ